MHNKWNKRGGDRESTWKWIHNNDRKNDPKSCEQNIVTDIYSGDKDWEDVQNI